MNKQQLGLKKSVKILRRARIDPKHDLFAALYFMPRINGKNNPDFGNAYMCGLKAGFSKSYAMKLASPQNGLTWLRDGYARLSNFTPEHIVKGIEDIAVNSEYDRDRLKAFDSLAKIKGMYIDRIQQEVQVTFTNSVPRPAVVLDGVIEAMDVSEGLEARPSDSEHTALPSTT